MEIEDIEITTPKDTLSFAAKCEKLFANTETSAEDRTEAIEELCEDIAGEKSRIRRTELIQKLCDVFGTKKQVIAGTVSDLIKEEKERATSEKLDIQDGADEDEVREFGIWEYKNRYWGLGKYGKYEICNFVMQVLFHIRTSDAAAFRLVKITNAWGRVAVVNLNTDDFVSLGAFKKVIARAGNFIFKGVDLDLGKIQEMLQRHERDTRMVQTLGWNKRGGFYAFCNGIVPVREDGEFEFIPADEYGILCLPPLADGEPERNFFIPANSKIFEDKESLYTNDKKFMYTKTESVPTFETWAAQMQKVYGEKAMAGILFYLAAIFRDVVYQAAGRRFPILNCYGQRGSGKGTFIESLMWLFGKPQDQIMLGGSSTAVGFMRKFAQFSNAIVWLDEYKNSLLQKIIESLKNIYDGIGYERGKKDNTFETESTPINSACILSGQEMPTAEPALFTRCILLQFTPGKGLTNEQRAEFEKLKAIQTQNLSHLTATIVQHRTAFAAAYPAALDACMKRIIKQTDNKEVDERLMLNIATLTATYRAAETFVKLPFTFEQAETWLIENMKRQHFILAGSDDVAKWWQCVQDLFVHKQLEEGRDFELSNGKLHLRVQQVHPLYQKEMRQRNDPGTLDKATLVNYLSMDALAYVGETRMRFSDGSNTWAHTFRYPYLHEQHGIDLIRIPDGDVLSRKEEEMGVKPTPPAKPVKEDGEVEPEWVKG